MKAELLTLPQMAFPVWMQFFYNTTNIESLIILLYIVEVYGMCNHTIPILLVYTASRGLSLLSARPSAQASASGRRSDQTRTFNDEQSQGNVI